MYGAMTVVVPAALFARGLTSRTASVNAMTAALGLMVWQGVKWMMAVMFLVLAPRIVPELSWPAMLAGLVVTMKVYWLALIWGKPKSTIDLNTTLQRVEHGGYEYADCWRLHWSSPDPSSKQAHGRRD
jgi:ATP synthase protein I